MGSTVRGLRDLIHKRESETLLKKLGAFGAIYLRLDTDQGELTLKSK